jgi:asparagine synthase (glutamine-hydrolysing)
MCGIAGIVALEGFDPAILIAMTNLVSYRGPDGRGFVFVDVHSGSAGDCIYNRDTSPILQRPSLGLGARRLAILDLSELGLQPMQIDNGDFWITYNGEIYNYLEIRNELEGEGESFRTHTDTEVILRAYRRWGQDCVKRFNGMWAFAIWDRKKRKLFCSRDRFGVKPFYYFVQDTRLVFGSEIKQILAYPGVPRTADESTVLQYLEQGVQDHSQNTFFAGILQLLPGHSMTIDLTSPTISAEIARYWELPIEPEDDMPEEDAVERLLTHLQRAVNWRLRSDVPVGSCLSGGLDSSSVVMLASKAKRAKEFHTFSSCFDEPAIDERRYMEDIVRSSGATPHYVFPQDQSFWDDLECLIWHQDEPFAGTSVYAQWCVMRAARQARIPVLLDGQGGDEILCGYRKFYIFYLWHLFKSANPRVLSEGIAWIRNVSHNRWSWSSAKRYAPFSYGPKQALLARVGSPALTSANHKSAEMRLGPGVSLRQRQKDDLSHFSIPALLHYEDRNSMAHSIEARVPMLDYELVSFAVNCRPSLKLRDGWTKWILRKAMRGVLPETVRLRKSKLGFSTPQREWLRNDTRGTIRSMIHEPDLKMSRILSRNKVHDEFDAFLAGKSSSLTEVEAFRVLSLELWARAFAVT